MGYVEDTEERELSPSELQEWISDADAIEVDLDELMLCLLNEQMGIAEESEAEEKRKGIAAFMRQALKQGAYKQAYMAAQELRKGGYSEYKIEIEDCIRKCADKNLTDAMIYEVEHFGQRADGSIREMAFPYLKVLADQGYIYSFRHLADCYYYGIGCERDYKKAERYYFEAMLFDCSSYVCDRYKSFHPELKDYDGDDELIRLIQCIAYDMSGDWKCACVKLGEMILEGKIKEYARECAYAVFYGNDGYDGISEYRIGECVFNGFGTERDLIPALVILEKAVDDLDYIVSYYDDEQSVSGWKSVFHNKKEYTQAFEEAKRLYKLAKEEASKFSDWEIAEMYSGLTDYDQIYERWESKRVKFIKRAGKGGEAS